MQQCDSKSLKTASTVHKTSKIVLFFEFLFIYVRGDVVIHKISVFFCFDHSHPCVSRGVLDAD
jgi:hypothetical protein